MKGLKNKTEFEKHNKSNNNQRCININNNNSSKNDTNKLSIAWFDLLNGHVRGTKMSKHFEKSMIIALSPESQIQIHKMYRYISLSVSWQVDVTIATYTFTHKINYSQ